jgi:hypothetical protein
MKTAFSCAASFKPRVPMDHFNAPALGSQINLDAFCFRIRPFSIPASEMFYSISRLKGKAKRLWI